MAAVYQYQDKRSGAIIYVGIVGKKGRRYIDDLTALKTRHIEHMTTKDDPLFRLEDYRFLYLDGITETDAEALETMLVATHRPKYNIQKKYDGASMFLNLLPIRFKEMAEDEIRKDNLVIDARHKGKAKARPITREKIAEIYADISESESLDDRTTRNFCIIGLLCESHLRITDIVRLRVCDLRQNGQALFVERLKREIHVGPELACRLQRLASESTAQWLFSCYRKTTPISVKTIQWIVRSCGKAVGIDNLSAATLRNSKDMY